MEYIVKYQSTPFNQNNPAVVVVTAATRPEAWGRAYIELTRRGHAVSSRDFTNYVTQGAVLTTDEITKVRELGIVEASGNVRILELIELHDIAAGRDKPFTAEITGLVTPTQQQLQAALEPLNVGFHVGAGDSPMGWSLRCQTGIVESNRRLASTYRNELVNRAAQLLRDVGYLVTRSESGSTLAVTYAPVAEVAPPLNHEYAFDVTIQTALRIHAPTEAQARAKLAELLDCADTNFGAIDGDPIIGEASMRGEAALYEIDWETVESPPMTAYDTLVSALKALLAYEDDRPGPGTFGSEVYAKAKTALANAERG